MESIESCTVSCRGVEQPHIQQLRNRSGLLFLDDLGYVAGRCGLRAVKWQLAVHSIQGHTHGVSHRDWGAGYPAAVRLCLRAAARLLRRGGGDTQVNDPCYL